MVYDSKRFKEFQAKRLANGKGQIKRPNRSKASAAYTRARLSISENIKEIVTKTRVILFGNGDTPFSEIETMGEWITAESKTQPPAEGHAPQYGYRMPKGISAQDLNKLNEEKPGIYGAEYATLSYPGGDGWQRVVMVSDGTRLRRLWLAVRHIAQELDCQEAQATGLILMGKLPLVSSLSATTHPIINKDKPSRGKLEITIREPISEAQLLRAYRKLREALWGDKRDRQPASDRDCLLVEFVMKNLDPDNPQWESLMKKWNQENPNFAFYGDSGYRGFRKAYVDAKQKIYPDIHWGEVTITN